MTARKPVVVASDALLVAACQDHYPTALHEVEPQTAPYTPAHTTADGYGQDNWDPDDIRSTWLKNVG